MPEQRDRPDATNPAPAPGASSRAAPGPAAATPAAANRTTPGGSPGDAKQTQEGTAQSLLPALTVPTGGGAIRSIGEKFEVNAATGTASLSIPLPTSPARGGQGPQVSLSYSSGGGNGPFGLGFSLRVPTISRKTDKGIPRYLDDAEIDTYVMSGAEDLVPLLDENDAPVFSTPSGYRAYRYRPRIEGLFARIERWVATSTRDVHWRVTTRDNTTHIYGLAPANRIADPEHPSHVFTWLLEETRDDKGNIVRYEYKPEDDVGVDPTKLSERSRFDYSTTPPTFLATAQRYLKRVLYCNAAPGVPDDFLMQLVFDYGEHSAIPELDPGSAPRPVRADPFSTHRSGFEIRTYRLCRRVLMFHRLNATREPLFVRETKLTYDETSPAFTYLTSVEQAGYLYDAVEDEWIRQALPRLDLDYQRPVVNDQLQILPEESREGLEGGTDGSRKQWVDLDGEGIPGVLIDQGGAWFYKANYGGGTLAPPKQLDLQPSPSALVGGTQKLEDLDGDGRLELVAFEPSLAGYFTRTQDGGFDPLRPFQSVPNVNWNDPNLRMIDLDGDGHADLLITEDQAFVWYRSKAREGYDESKRVAVPFDEQDGPRVVFANSEQQIQLADMSGDGLGDIVRVRNGEVSYWPNLGYGRFGKKVTLENSPVFATPDQFHASRVRFGDIDGSGTSDLLYAGGDGVTFYANESGNRLATGIPIRALPPVDHVTQLSVTDLLGNGTSCLVWSSPLGLPTQTLLYVDVMGSKKPHLLTTTTNNLGATTTLTYASSTKFYLEDKLAGKPWLTRLPFPVQVVEKVETQDAISGGRLTRQYRYRHGFFDGEEQEFRGFARVEQTDAEDFAAPNEDPLLYQPPVRTVSWFHTGAWLERERLEDALSSEYWNDGPPALLVKDTILPLGMSVQDEREAARALKGSPLRTEVYADDDDIEKKDVPFVITETNHEVRRLQTSRGENRFGVFFSHPRESVTVTTERIPDDPRVAHEFILDVDDYGNVTRKASLVYGRSGTGHPEEQTRACATLTESAFINKPDEADWYRVGIEYQSATYELTGLSDAIAGFPADFPTVETGLVDIEAFRLVIDGLDPGDDLAFEDPPTMGVERRLVEKKQLTFASNDQATELALGEIESLALPRNTYQLALTPGLVQQIVDDSLDLTGTAFDPNLLVSEGKYTIREGSHWTQGAIVTFDAANFYVPVEATDPFDGTSAVTWDDFFLLPATTTDPVGNTTSAENDYRVLSPRLITDINDNQTEVAFDALGMLVATAVMGKSGSGDGDTLADPTARLEYDLLAYQNGNGPSFVKTIAREKHGAANPRFQESYAYSDGVGRVIQQKVQAEPGDAPLRDTNGELQRDTNGDLILGHVEDRWVGTGRTIFNNKGNPVKQYEPFFSSTHEYESEADLVEWGVTPIITYDSIDRVIRTDLPDGTFTKVEFDSWQQRSYDQNDTVQDSTWYADRGSRLTTDPEPTDPDERAAWLAAQHYDTPTIAHLDSLGRPFLSEANNNDTSPYQTRTKLDIEGNALAIYDARQIDRNPTTPVATIEQTYDVLGRRIKVVSADAGTRLTLQDAAGKPLRAWNTRGFTTRSQYDDAQRPTHTFVAKGATENLVARMSYGESISLIDPKTVNLRGRLHLAFDGAGLVKTNEVDFKGNVLSATRRLATWGSTTPTWDAIAAFTAPHDLETNAPLESEAFTTTTQYDALNRVTQSTTPDASVTIPEYNEANLLERLTVDPKGTGARVVVGNIEYNARGQRLFCEHAENSGTPSHTTTYEYDPKTFRVTRIRTLTSSSTVLQDLQYTHDPVGNITELTDASTWDTTLASQNPTRKYVYDALYRLTSATGREHAGQQPTDEEPPYRAVPHSNDLYDNLRGYREELTYDRVGNILQMRHLTGPSNTESWSRNYDYELDNNRLKATSVPGDASGTYSATYEYETGNDAGLHGSMTVMPHLDVLEWDYADRLQHTEKSNGSSQHTYFTYDGAGQRVRKVYAHNGLVEERIYLGGFEIYRRHAGTIAGAVELARETLHVMDDTRRVAMVETKTADPGSVDPAPLNTPRWRYQLDDHLGSSAMELTDTATVISHEEYHPYGSTAFHSADGAYVSRKRYRYTGKEKDDETGLYYHGARYYAPWLGRWTSADPAGMVDGLNLYRYSRDNPLSFSDPGGTQAKDEKGVRVGVTEVWDPHDLEAHQLNEAERVLVPKIGAKPRDVSTGTSGESTEGAKPTEPRVSASEEWLKKLPALEGSYAAWSANAANRDDRGGETNYGITWSTYQKLRPGATKEEFTGLTEADVKRIARGLFRAYGTEGVKDPGVAILLADSFWGGFSKDALNRALEVVGQKPLAQQGKLTAEVLAEINSADANALTDAYLAERNKYHEKLAASDPSQRKFVKGWDRRFRTRWIQAKMLGSNAGEAAKWLNGQSLEVLQGQLSQLSTAEIAALHAAAVATPGVGPKSRFAELTKKVHDQHTAKPGGK